MSVPVLRIVAGFCSGLCFLLLLPRPSLLQFSVVFVQPNSIWPRIWRFLRSSVLTSKAQLELRQPSYESCFCESGLHGFSMQVLNTRIGSKRMQEQGSNCRI